MSIFNIMMVAVNIKYFQLRYFLYKEKLIKGISYLNQAKHVSLHRVVQLIINVMRFFMSIVPSLKNEKVSSSRFLDWCKYKNIFYNNLYLEDYDWVIKMPIIPQGSETQNNKIKLKKFDLTKYVYLISYQINNLLLEWFIFILVSFVVNCHFFLTFYSNRKSK